VNIYREYITGCPQVHYRFFDFDKYQSKSDFIFIDCPQELNQIPLEIFNNKILYLELEEPNRFFSDVAWFNHFSYDKYFNKVFSTCPYTVKWKNDLNYQYVFMPFLWEPQIKTEKLFDIVYVGHLYEGPIEENIQVLKYFDYRIASNTEHPMNTNKSISYQEKLKLVSQAKITLVHNLLYPTAEHIKNVKMISRWNEHEAFSLIDQGIVPQIKMRTIEAAMCKSLILCQQDPFNVIEQYFTNDEFVYYDKQYAREQITDILNNYDKYLPIIEKAFIKVQNYTTKVFFEKYLKDQ
jgi:glycosyl transferase family 1